MKNILMGNKSITQVKISHVRPCLGCGNHSGIKPWPNGLASRRKFWTCVQLAFHLASHLRRLASTCVDFGGAQIWMQVDASILPPTWPPTKCKSTQVDRK